MNPIEDDLRAALRRKPAPPGFSQRLMERAGDGALIKTAPGRPLRLRSWILAAAAMVVLTAGAGVFQYRRYVQARNEAALQRTLTALSIAAAHLDRAEKKAFESFSNRLSGFEIDVKR